MRKLISTLKSFIFRESFPSISLKDNIVKLIEKVTIDKSTNTLIIDSDLHIHITGDFTISSGKNLMLMSNKDNIDPNTGLCYSVFINTDEDQKNKLIIDEEKQICQTKHQIK